MRYVPAVSVAKCCAGQQEHLRQALLPLLPQLANVGSSLSQQTYFLAKTETGWVVWERAR